MPNAVEAEYGWLHEYLVIRRPKFSRDRYTGRVSYDGEEHEQLFDFETESFPSGFLPQVVRKARDRGFEVTVHDERVRPALPDMSADVAWLRDYQHHCLTEALNRGRGIIHAATGGGKTEIIAGLTRTLPTTKFLILVHRSQLMRDIKRRIVKRSIEHGYGEPTDIGLYGDGEKELGARITIATFQSLAKNRKNPAVKAMLKAAEALLIDEAHTSPASQFTSIIEQATNAYYRWGVSGTPLDRSDKRSIVTIGLLGPVIARVSAKELIDRGILAKPLVRLCRFDAQDVYASEWAQVRTQGIVESRARNQAVLNAVRRAAKPCVLFVEILEHGQFLTQKLQQGGINAQFVWGNTKTAEREAALERLVRADIDVVVASTVLNEGIDVPSLRSVVLAAGGKSVIQVLQRIGRGMRRTEDKATFEIWDFEDVHHRMLEDHYIARKRAYGREGHEVVLDTEVLKLPPAVPPQRRLVAV